MLKYLSSSILILAAITGSSMAQQGKEESSLSVKLSFLNGDTFSGQIMKWSSDEIQIKSEFLVDPATFPTSSLLDVKLESEEIPMIQKDDTDAKDKSITTIKINNRFNMSDQHDVLKGEFKQIDKDTISINTSYAGELLINRNMINKMWIETETGYIYRGPNSLKEWHSTKPSQNWKFRAGALIAESTASISKDVKLPKKAILSLDHEWKNNAYFTVKLYSSDYEMSRPKFCYEFVSRYGRFYVQKVFENRTTRLPANQQLGRAAFNNIRRGSNNKKSAHYDIYMNLEKGLFHIYANGKLKGTFTDQDAKPEKFGTGIHFYNHNNSKSKISKIKITGWNGNKPSDTDDSTLKALKGDGQKVLLRNGDAVLGQIGTIEDGFIEVVTEFGPLKIPVTGMRTIDLSSSEKHQPKRYKEDIKAWFNDQEWIILKPIEFNGSKLKAFHQAFGEKKFDLRAFKRIDLHINNEKINELRKVVEW